MLRTRHGRITTTDGRTWRAFTLAHASPMLHPCHHWQRPYNIMGQHTSDHPGRMQPDTWPSSTHGNGRIVILLLLEEMEEGGTGRP